jgi:GrpB-like predicted nucleotidyltransferase (UPF0157 family)
MMEIPYSTKIRLAKLEGQEAMDALYPEYVSHLIHEKYSINTELALLRQMNSKPEDFDEYNSFAEECKARARREIYGE